MSSENLALVDDDVAMATVT